MKIRVVIPAKQDQSVLDRLHHNYAQAGNAESEISFSFLSDGPNLDAPYRELTVLMPELVFKLKEAEGDGVETAVIAHYLDLGLAGGREFVSIPVVGSGHTTLRLASLLSRRIAIITSVHAHLAPIEDLVAAEGVSDKVVSIRSIEMPSQDAQNGQCPDQLRELSREVVERDGADLIILALHGYNDFSSQLETYLASQNHVVQVLDPLRVAIKQVENLVAMGVSHSKITYPDPEIREIIGYDHLPFK